MSDLFVASAKLTFGVAISEEELEQAGCESLGDFLEMLKEMHPLDAIRLLMDLDELFGWQLDIKS